MCHYLCVASSASAQEQTLTTYTTLTAPEYVDAGVKGMSVGDMYVRRGDVALSADGKHTHDGAIIGGTGAYAGIRGTYTPEIAPSGKDAHSQWLASFCKQVQIPIVSI